MPMTRATIQLFVMLALAACTDALNPTPRYQVPDMDELARQYLFLELSMGNIDGAHVDAYFGPDDIKTRADNEQLGLDDIREQAGDLDVVLGNVPASAGIDMARIEGLRARLRALDTRISINKDQFLPFDEETMALFGTIAPSFDEAHFDDILQQIDAMLPGDGSLSSRVDAFKNRFAIPREKLPQVFDAAIAECRRRTLQHIDLEDGESFTIEYVTDKPWSGYNWYQGNSVSLIQVNTDLPIFISRAVDLGCHEGYPGHHTFNALLEKNLVVDKGWLEYSLYPLFSPESVIAEGSGNYGIKLAFPGSERATYEKSVLFALAGLDASEADAYYELESLLRQLNYAGNEAARGYLNGQLTREQAIEWLARYTLTSVARAEQRTRFFDAYRSYVINYNHGMKLVADFVERDDADSDERWVRFKSILSAPVLPADLEH